MTTHIKQERFDEFEKRAFEYGFKKRGNKWRNTTSNKRTIYVKENGDVYAFEDGEVVTDLPYEYIDKLVWDGFIKKVE